MINELKRTYFKQLIMWLVFLAIMSIILMSQGELELFNFLKALFIVTWIQLINATFRFGGLFIS